MELVNPTITNLIIFVLAIYVGYHVVWTVTPALHTPQTETHEVGTRCRRLRGTAAAVGLV